MNPPASLSDVPQMTSDFMENVPLLSIKCQQILCSDWRRALSNTKSVSRVTLAWPHITLLVLRKSLASPNGSGLLPHGLYHSLVYTSRPQRTQKTMMRRVFLAEAVIRIASFG